MPTAARLVAAFALAAVMYLATLQYIPGLPEGTQTGRIAEIAAGVGAICGWMFVGNAPGKTFAEGLSNGTKGAAIACFWVLMGASVYMMIRKSMRMMYDGVSEAVLGVFEHFIELGALLFVPGVSGVLLGGGMIAGALTRGAGKRWK
jgi:hypothetical protein